MAQTRQQQIEASKAPVSDKLNKYDAPSYVYSHERGDIVAIGSQYDPDVSRRGNNTWGGANWKLPTSGNTLDNTAPGTTPKSRTEIDTRQPSPTRATQQVTQGLPGSPQDTVQFDAKTGQALAPGATTTDALGNTFTQGQKYKEALGKLKATGAAPQDAGQGKMLAQGAVQTPTQPVSPLGGIMEVDSNFDSIFTELDKYMEPLQQKKTLLQEYQSMSRALGIQDINEELIDAKRIMEGTEDDIRAEVTAAGGFATDSQVLALANSRNKSLIKNYNVLLESRDNAMQQLNTMMNLTMEDRKAAEAEFDRKMGFVFKVAEFKERAKANAVSQFQWLAGQPGGLEAIQSMSSDPYYDGLINKVLGGVGGLDAMVARQQEARQMALKEQQLGIDIKKAQLYGVSLDNQKKLKDLSSEEPQGVDDLYQQERSTRILQSVGELKGRVGRSTVGFFGSNLARIAGTPARDFRADLDTLKANIFSGELTAMRAASKTGGAVGNVSDKEGDKLQSALGALDQAQSTASFNRNLQQIEDSIVRWYEALHGEGLTVAPDGSGNLIRIID